MPILCKKEGAIMPRSTKRSKLGRFLEKHGYNQSQLSKMADLNKNTVTRIYTDSSYMPSGNTISKVMKALKRLDPSLKAEDFFDV
jgi:DNA-binding XRE family transcriptional regulator